MARILLILTVTVTAGVLLWSAWRLDRRLFAALALVVAVVILIPVTQITGGHDDPWQPLSRQAATIQVKGYHPTGFGVRVAGKLINEGQQPLARVIARVQLLDCEGRHDDSCEVVAKAPLTLRLQVPPGRGYPFSDMIRINMNRSDETRRWSIQIQRVYGYAH